MERLCTADFVDVPVAEGHAFLRSYRPAPEPDDFIGIPLDPHRPPLQFRYANDRLVRGEQRTDSTSLLSRVSRVTPTLYRNAGAPATVRAVPFGNAFAFSTEARFRNLTLRPDNDLFGGYLKYAREHYRFPDNPVTVVYGPDGTPTLRVDQRSADRRRGDVVRPNGPHVADLAVALHVDRFPAGTSLPKRVTVKLNLLNQTCVHENSMTACSVTHRVRLTDTVVEEAFSTFPVPGLRENHASAFHKFFEYSVGIPYNGIFYPFVVTFRKTVDRATKYYPKRMCHYESEEDEGGYDDHFVDKDKYDDYLDDFHTLRVECRESIEFDTFARIATTLIDFFAYQHTTYNGLVDEFVSHGPKWKKFRGGIGDGVRASIECLTLNPTCFCDDSDEDTESENPLNQYDGFTVYLGLKRMADMSPKFRSQIFKLPDNELAIKHYRIS